MTSRVERQPLLGMRKTPKMGLCARLCRLVATVANAFKKYFSCFTTQTKSLKPRDVCLMRVTSDGFLVPQQEQAKRKPSKFTSVGQALQARSRFEEEPSDDLLLAEKRVELEESIVEPMDSDDEDVPMAFSFDGTLKPVRNLKRVFDKTLVIPVQSEAAVTLHPRLPLKPASHQVINWFRPEID